MSNANESRQKLTVIIPSFNEEARIEACLKSVAWADEILLVDSFSTDRTLEIAQKYAHRILQHGPFRRPTTNGFCWWIVMKRFRRRSAMKFATYCDSRRSETDTGFFATIT